MLFVGQTLVKAQISLANLFCALQQRHAVHWMLKCLVVPLLRFHDLIYWMEKNNGEQQRFVISWTNVSMRRYFNGSRISVTWQLVNGIHFVLNDNLSKTFEKCDWATLHCHCDVRGCIQGNASKIIIVCFTFNVFAPLIFLKRDSDIPKG